MILGGGATATSALAALGQLGVTRAVVAVRDRARAGALHARGHQDGRRPFASRASTRRRRLAARADVVVSTIPADAGAERGRGAHHSVGHLA